jgi:hypothetical protein
MLIDDAPFGVTPRACNPRDRRDRGTHRHVRSSDEHETAGATGDGERGWKSRLNAAEGAASRTPSVV